MGLTYSLSDYDTQRYTRLAAIVAEIVESHTGLPAGPALENFLVQPGYATPKVDVRASDRGARWHFVGPGARSWRRAYAGRSG